MEKNSLLIKVCDQITKYSIFVLVALMPVFFLPWTSDVLDFNKQMLLVVFASLAMFAWMLRVLVSSKFHITLTKVHISVGVLFLVYVLATIFSVDRYGSFWGVSQGISESLLTFIGLLFVYFLVSNVFSQKNIITALTILSVSVFAAQILGILQLFGIFIIPFSFAKSVLFNVSGSVGALGFISAIILPLAITSLINTKKWWKMFFGAQIVLSFVLLCLINYRFVWLAVVCASAFIMVFGILKRNVIDGRWMGIPMFFLAISLFFILLSPQLTWLGQGSSEIYLSQRASFDIATKALKERPILGSGPGTFGYDFSKFKNPDYSKTSIWNLTFNKGASELSNSLATTGVVGFVALLAFLLYPAYLAVRFLMQEKLSRNDSDVQKEHSKNHWILVLGLSASLFVGVVSYAFYNANVTLAFTFFFILACVLSFIAKEKKKEYELKASSVTTLTVTFAFTLILIFGLGILILDGQRYVAELNYHQGLAFMGENKLLEGTAKLENAASLNSGYDLYFRQLSQAYLVDLNDVLNAIKDTPTDEQKNQIQFLITNSVNAAKIATDLSPKTAINWSSRGYVYQSLYGLIPDAEKWANDSYDEGLKLDPNNPYLFMQKGNVDYISYVNTQETAKRNEFLASAKVNLEKGLALNENYSALLYSLGLVQDALGEKTKSLETFTKLQQLNPEDTSIPKIISNLKAGLPAIQSQNLPTTTPPEESSPTTQAPSEDGQE